ncbi:hypothetical protein D3C74_141370 [compost metagenome]
MNNITRGCLCLFPTNSFEKPRMLMHLVITDHGLVFEKQMSKVFVRKSFFKVRNVSSVKTCCLASSAEASVYVGFV